MCQLRTSARRLDRRGRNDCSGRRDCTQKSAVETNGQSATALRPSQPLTGRIRPESQPCPGRSWKWLISFDTTVRRGAPTTRLAEPRAARGKPLSAHSSPRRWRMRESDRNRNFDDRFQRRNHVRVFAHDDVIEIGQVLGPHAYHKRIGYAGSCRGKTRRRAGSSPISRRRAGAGPG
jgi:hypothetical protein